MGLGAGVRLPAASASEQEGRRLVLKSCGCPEANFAAATLPVSHERRRLKDVGTTVMGMNTRSWNRTQARLGLLRLSDRR